MCCHFVSMNLFDGTWWSFVTSFNRNWTSFEPLRNRYSSALRLHRHPLVFSVIPNTSFASRGAWTDKTGCQVMVEINLNYNGFCEPQRNQKCLWPLSGSWAEFQCASHEVINDRSDPKWESDFYMKIYCWYEWRYCLCHVRSLSYFSRGSKTLPNKGVN